MLIKINTTKNRPLSDRNGEALRSSWRRYLGDGQVGLAAVLSRIGRRGGFSQAIQPRLGQHAA